MTIGKAFPGDGRGAGAAQLIGQMARDPLGKGLEQQTREILERIDGGLQRLGLNRSNVTLATIWMRDLSDFPQMNPIWIVWITEAWMPRTVVLEDHDLPEHCSLRIDITAYC